MRGYVLVVRTRQLVLVVIEESGLCERAHGVVLLVHVLPVGAAVVAIVVVCVVCRVGLRFPLTNHVYLAQMRQIVQQELQSGKDKRDSDMFSLHCDEMLAWGLRVFARERVTITPSGWAVDCFATCTAHSSRTAIIFSRARQLQIKGGSTGVPDACVVSLEQQALV
jgi:hypothetical protein